MTAAPTFSAPRWRCSPRPRSRAGVGAAWIALPLFVGLPLADTAIAVVRRRRSGRPVLAGDRSHVYDQLADRGWPTSRVVLVCAAMQAAATAAGLLSWRLGAPGAVAVVAVVVVAASAAVWRIGFVQEGAPA